MSPMYRQGEAYPHPYPAYFSAPPNVEPQPIWLEPREPQPHYYYREAQPHYYYRETPKQPWPDEWSSYEGRPYLYHYPYEGGYFYYPPEYRNSPPRINEPDGMDYGRERFYEPDGMDYGRERFYEPDGGEFHRYFRPMYIDPPSSSVHVPYACRPFHPGEQFRHPDEYPMRFVPASYGPSEQRKVHCCGCPNHVCHPETKTMKEIEPKQITDGKFDEKLKPKSQNLKEFPGPFVVFPSGWRNRASSPERIDHIEEKDKHPVNWIPVNWNRNDREPSRDRKGEDKEQSPAYWFPVNWVRNDETHDPRFQGYLTPQGSNISPQDEKGKNIDATVEGKLHPFPLIWIPDGHLNMSNINTQEESKSPNSQASREDTKKTNGVESRPVTLQAIGKEEEKERPAEVKKEIKARDIPVKQVEEEKTAVCVKAEEKSSQPQKTQEKVGDNHHKTSSPKSSKLPPVCLRVDPLPGKKKSNGKSSSSRSPSPPRKSENPKASATSSAPIENANPDASTKIFVEAKKAEENAKMIASKKVEENLDASTNANIGTGKPKEDEKMDDPKVAENENMQGKEADFKKCEVSRDHAALKIQSFYRGCQVRRLQPLRKLREIAKIRERVKELKQQILSPEFVGELGRDEKVKVRTHETLMGLLLQLDTIQGLHPVVRDVRKAVARELVLLQEQLDSWTEVACNNSMQQQQSCMQGSTEINMSVEDEIIEKHDRDLEATKEINSIVENQRVDNEARTDEEKKAHDKQDPLEIKKEMREEDRKETPVKEGTSNEEKKEVTSKKCSDDGKQNVAFEQEHYATEQCESVQGNTLLNQEASEVSENVETSALSVVEMGNHDKDADSSGQMITTPDNTLENINEEEEKITTESISVSNTLENMNEEKEKITTESISVSNTEEENLENMNEEKEKITTESISVSNSEEANLENMKAGVEEKSEPQMNKDSILPQDLDSILPQDLDMQPEMSALSTLVQELEISDITSGSRSDAYEENNLISSEKKPPVEDNASGKREFTDALAQETYNPLNQQSIEAPTTEDVSDVNFKDEYSIQIEECQEDHALKCNGLSEYMEFRASDSAEKFVMEPFSPTNDSESENLMNQSKANKSQYGSEQNEEKWEEENEKLREMVGKLVESGKQQMSTIAQLNDKIKSLESKLSRENGKKQTRARHLKMKSKIVGRNMKNASAFGC